MSKDAEIGSLTRLILPIPFRAANYFQYFQAINLVATKFLRIAFDHVSQNLF